MPVAELNYKVIHNIPGRIRIKILPNLNFAELVNQVQEKIIKVSGITQIRVNPQARSVIINFKENLLSNTMLVAQLDEIFKPTTEISNQAIEEHHSRETETPSPDGLESKQKLPESWHINLISNENVSSYEKKEIEQIRKWQRQEQEENFLFVSVATSLLNPLKQACHLIPEDLIIRSFQICESLSDKWHLEWQHIKSHTKVDTPVELQKGDLEECDKICETVKNQANFSACIELGAIALWEGIGELINVPVAIIIAVQTIHKIGLCYGFTPDTEQEKFVAWTILAIATAETLEEKQVAFSSFYSCQQKLYRQNFDQFLEEFMVEELLHPIKEVVFHQAIVFLGKNLTIEMIPFIGVVADIVINQEFIKKVSEGAQKAYQAKWLIANNKLKVEVFSTPVAKIITEPVKVPPKRSRKKPSQLKRSQKSEDKE